MKERMADNQGLIECCFSRAHCFGGIVLCGVVAARSKLAHREEGMLLLCFDQLF